MARPVLTGGELVAGVLPARILVHTATPVQFVEAPSEGWAEGEPGEGVEPALGVPFQCVLFLPGPGGEQSSQYRPRVVRTPTLLYNPTRDDDSVVVVNAEDELLVEAPELAPWTGADVVRWLAEGDPQPFGPPGLVYGLMATLRRVED